MFEWHGPEVLMTTYICWGITWRIPVYWWSCIIIMEKTTALNQHTITSSSKDYYFSMIKLNRMKHMPALQKKRVTGKLVI